MGTNYTGDASHTQAPAAIPSSGVAPIVVLPADGDSDNGATFAQAFKVLADYVAYAQTHLASAETNIALLQPNPIVNFFGDASDGNVTLDGVASVSGLAGPTSNVYNLQRNFYCNTLTINSGVTLDTSAWKLYANTIINNGTISADGWDGAASDSTDRQNGFWVGGTAWVIGGGADAGKGGLNATPGGAGKTVGNTPYLGSPLGGASGAGGLGSSAAGGASGGVTNVTIRPRDVLTAFQGFGLRGDSPSYPYPFLGGAGGGGGGTDGATAGAQGGTGGNVCWIAAKVLTNNGIIRAKGGNGGSPAGGNRGGGGGGGGGALILIYRTITVGTLSVAGGTGGTKQGTGVNGSNGSSGTTWQFVV